MASLSWKLESENEDAWKLISFRLNISAQTDILLARSARADFLNTVSFPSSDRNSVLLGNLPILCVSEKVATWKMSIQLSSSNQVAELTEAMRGNEQVPMKNLQKVI